jgi:hypothetical protein
MTRRTINERTEELVRKMSLSELMEHAQWLQGYRDEIVKALGGGGGQ